jgi:hypothetical protein
MYYLDVNDEWSAVHHDDLWIYNKLQLSRVLGYNCGPVGAKVPKPDFYIVRPSINFLGMGRFAEVKWIKGSTNHFHPSNFWCEVFKGEHLSVDFYQKESSLVVRGIKSEDDPLYKWKRWEKIDRKVEFPSILNNLKGNYDWINCEFINGNLIEVHIRRNPDFRYQNDVAIPVWDNEVDKNEVEDAFYVADLEYDTYGRTGIYVK